MLCRESSVEECFLSTHGVLGSLPSTAGKEKNKLFSWVLEPFQTFRFEIVLTLHGLYLLGR